MNEYVPTTEEVRDNYTWGASACGCCAEYRDEDYEKFDRWLAAHDAEVAAKALEDAVSDVREIAVEYAKTAQSMSDTRNWEDATRYFHYANGMNIAAGRFRARAAEYRKEEEVSENVVGVMTAEEAIEMVMQRPGLYGLHTEEELAEAWDEGHGAPCDKWIRAEMCREYHPNPYRKAVQS